MSNKKQSFPRTKLNENYSKLVLGTAKKNYDANKAKIDKMTPEQIYMLAYLHGYESCFNVYDLGGDIMGTNLEKADGRDDQNE